MAVPVDFKPTAIDPRAELMRKVQSAPRDHAEALLVAWSTLQTAHDKGILDLLEGLMSGRDVIATELAKAMKSTEGVNLLRNAIALGGMLAAIDPTMLHKMSRAFAQSMAAAQAEEKPPSVWQLARRLMSEDGRRGLSVATHLVSGLGSAVSKD